MYHYLKWAALSLFFKRNLKYLLLIFVSIVLFYLSNSLYQDLVKYQIAIGHSERILYLLTTKWIIILISIGLFIFSLSKLGLQKDKDKDVPKKITLKDRLITSVKPNKISKDITPPNNKKDSTTPKKSTKNRLDEINQRLESFNNSKKIRNRSKIILDRKKDFK